MNDLTADTPAIALGVGVGVAAGFYARQALYRAIRHDDRDPPTAWPVPGWLLAIIGGVSGALIGARFGMQARLPAYLYLTAIAPALGAVDAAAHRLPNRILLPAYPVAAALLGFAAWRDSDAEALWRGLLAGALLYATFLAVALMSPPGSLGWADVKLSGLVAAFLGFLGWSTLLRGMTIAFVSAAVYVVVRRLVRRGHHGHLLPLGPALLFGTLVAVIVS